ncbi:MAG: hypothetical protein D6679_03520 [Candidatus Hydrogenedentota bacterium]|nr:MAG: hypothetical protein D6679_03520 [Candidatus Hydrogenedentota bacterium]
MKHSLSNISHELKHHLPLTLVSAGVVTILFAFLPLLHDLSSPTAILASRNLFHVFHSLHVLLSATATTAMFWRYDRRWVVAVGTGLFGAIAFCGLSDVLFPYFGGLLLGTRMTFHLCLLEEPVLIWSSAGVGVLFGLSAAEIFTSRRVTQTAHSLHVFLSTTASMIYFTSYGLPLWTQFFLPVLLILVAAVLIPCCTSDVIFPLFLANPAGVHLCGGACLREDAGPAQREAAETEPSSAKRK